ncbi:glycosyltransferase family 2 protein [Shewanella frigidimarina]|uniref:glycosyltransferase family 2 protein n=1 Tax=Shewanella frigidimarina TaxID=56812 RepID=UPI000F4F8B6E|nr:glycosyltransferase family 2 protein [Shewanella frigidimarina]RPA63839.1 glycosyltransferase family 2 protein [Shewanella frigidimarina]
MPLISFIIPTHNRFEYAIKTINSLLSINSDIEIVISDTSDNDKLVKFCSSHINKTQLKLVRPGQGISVVDNFNYGLQHATGEFLVFIGDDDFVCNSVIDVANWAHENLVESIRFSFPVTYFWPDFKHRNQGDIFSGTLSFTEYSGSVILHDTKKALNEALNDFGRGVLNMPRAYSGMISRLLAERITIKYGSLFGGVSPDIYSSTLISSESMSSYLIDYPVVVPGASGASTSGLSAKGQHTGKLRDNPHIGAFQNLVWDNRIPEFYSVPTVWAYSFLKALETVGIDPKSINFSILYLRCFLYYPQYRTLTFNCFNSWRREHGFLVSFLELSKSFLKELFWVLSIVFKRVIKRISKRVNKDNVYLDLDDVLDAKYKCETVIKSRGISIDFKNKVD